LAIWILFLLKKITNCAAEILRVLLPIRFSARLNRSAYFVFLPLFLNPFMLKESHEKTTMVYITGKIPFFEYIKKKPIGINKIFIKGPMRRALI